MRAVKSPAGTGTDPVHVAPAAVNATGDAPSDAVTDEVCPCVVTLTEMALRCTEFASGEVTVTVDLKSGAHRATVWTNDLTHAYVHENSAYSS